MKLGFRVVAAWNGKEALEYLAAAQQGKHAKPDIILMDVQMPVIDGYKCTHLLRCHMPYKAYASDVPVVAMTASAIQGDKEKCRKAGMDDYLAKPVKSKTLEKMLVRWSQTKRRSPSPLRTSDPSPSECSDMPGHCSSVDIPLVGIDSPTSQKASNGNASLSPQVSSGGSGGDNSASALGGPFDPATPTPLTHGNHQEPSPFDSAVPSEDVKSLRRQESDEMDLQAQTGKLIEAAGGGREKPPMSRGPSFQDQDKGDSLTEANMEKHDQEGKQQQIQRDMQHHHQRHQGPNQR